MANTKKKYPLEIKNMWEWNPQARPADYESSEESSELANDTEYTDEWGDSSSTTSGHQPKPSLNESLSNLQDRPVDDDVNEGWSMVSYKSNQQALRPKKENAKGAVFSAPHKPQAAPLKAMQNPRSGPLAATQKVTPAIASTKMKPTAPRSLGLQAHSIQSISRAGSSILKKPSLKASIGGRESRGRPPTRVNRRIFNPAPDNAAKAAFRKRAPPDERFELYKDACEVASLEATCSALEEIGVRCRSFVRPPQYPQDRTILIWGDARQVSKTNAALKEWLKTLEEPPTGRQQAKEKQFVKENSTIHMKYKQEQARFKKSAATKLYQQVPDPDKTFEFTLAFIWPADDFSPYEVFGRSLEAFDAIRVKYRCHIIFDDKMGAFRAFARKKEAIDAVQQHFQVALNALNAHSRRKIVEYLVDPPSSLKMREEIQLLQGPSKGDGKPTAIRPRLSGKLLGEAFRSKWTQRASELRRANHEKIEQDLIKVIPILPYYRGELRIRIAFGMFQLQFLRCPEHQNKLPVEDFLNNIQLARTKGSLICDLGLNDKVAAIMASIHSTKDLFMPADHCVEKLEDVHPVVSARFVVLRLDKASVQLDIEADRTSSIGDFHEIKQSRWSRYDGKDVQIPLSIHSIHLDGAPSWEFNFSLEHSLDDSKIEPRMREFAGTIQPNHRDITRSCLAGRPLMSYGSQSPGSIIPSEYEQKIAFRYRLVSAPQWVFEIAKYDTFGTQNRGLVNSRWGATMWNGDWDSLVASNSGLEIGERASWSPRLRAFFPNGENKKIDGVEAGIAEFTELVQRVNHFLQDIQGSGCQ